MSLRSGDLTEKWYEYVYRDRAESVRRFVEQYPDERALSVSCDRVGHDYRFVRPLLARPDEALRAGRAALRQFCADETDRDVGDRDFGDAYLRVTDLPGDSEVTVGELRADHLNRLYTVRGTVAEKGPVRPKVVRAGFRCAKCDAVTRQVVQRGRRFRSHAKCPDCNSVGYLSFAPAASEYVDAREVELRDPDGGRGDAGGERRESSDDRRGTVTALLEHDLVDAASTGESIRLVAIPRASRTGGSAVADVWLESVSVE
ncbi:minichromosome maintenance protein MCM [Halorussus halobius]|uniref:minichromosome maintenance protein MCM n=1 Tax=Halorussus halobius TaxID=1710537 RepID=UPI0010921738|nr:minichromosome maintenance protein MCM [Halorussus halobius]